MDLHGVLEKLKSLVRQTGEYQLAQFRSSKPGGGDKKNEREMVSHIDIESERRLIEGLARILPEAAVFGEETVQNRSNGFTWVVDPLDGTTNYLAGLDEWSISVALLQEEEIILAVVVKPFSAETFCAIRNMGAYYNNQRLHPIPDFPLKKGLIGTGFPYRSPDTRASFFPCLEEVLYASRGVRRAGSAALDLCHVGAGFLQGFFEVDLASYDVAAGLLILQETGCPFSEFDGSPYKLFSSRSLVTGFPGLQNELQEICARHYGDSVYSGL